MCLLPPLEGFSAASSTVFSTSFGLSAFSFGLALTFAFSFGSPFSSNSRFGTFLQISNVLPPKASDIASSAPAAIPAAPWSTGSNTFLRAPVKTPAPKALPKSFSIASTAAPTARPSFKPFTFSNSSCRFFGLGICETNLS